MDWLNLETVSWERGALLICVCALAASAITELVRQTLNGYLSHRRVERKQWWKPGLLRTISVSCAALTGYLLGGNTLGLVIGVAAGGLTTSVVAAVKGIIKKKATSVADDF